MKIRIVMLIAILYVLALVQPVAADAPIAGRAGRAEMRFMQGMIDHHMMAIDMANDCLTKARTEQVTLICQNIIKAQRAEVDIMTGWLQDWYNSEYKPTSMMSMMSTAMPMDMTMEAGHSDGAMHDPAGMMGMMAGLNALEGNEYEIAWLEAMVDHHDDALHMSQRVLRYAEHEELRELANKIITDQTAEIEQMEALITEMSK